MLCYDFLAYLSKRLLCVASWEFPKETRVATCVAAFTFSLWWWYSASVSLLVKGNYAKRWKSPNKFCDWLSEKNFRKMIPISVMNQNLKDALTLKEKLKSN